MDEFTKTVFAATADLRHLLDAIADHPPPLRLLDAAIRRANACASA